MVYMHNIHIDQITVKPLKIDVPAMQLHWSN